jgi:hypothetical protein
MHLTTCAKLNTTTPRRATRTAPRDEGGKDEEQHAC